MGTGTLVSAVPHDSGWAYRTRNEPVAYVFDF